MSIEMKAYQNGPLVITGKLRVSKGDGRLHEASGESVALCRCGRSGKDLFCDGTHSRVEFRAREFDLKVDPLPEAPR